MREQFKLKSSMYDKICEKQNEVKHLRMQHRKSYYIITLLHMIELQLAHFSSFKNMLIHLHIMVWKRHFCIELLELVLK